MKNKFLKTGFIVIIVAVLILIFDMLTKYVLIENLIPNVGDQAPFIEGFINFVHVQNEGASYGIFSGQTVFLIIVTLVLLVILCWYYLLKLKGKKNKYLTLLSISMGFIFGGSIGNLYDRIFFGYVRDFINFQFMNFPVFNIADSAITIGVILLVIYFVREYVFFIKKSNKMIKIEEDKTSKIAKEASEFNQELADILNDDGQIKKENKHNTKNTKNKE